MRVSLSVLCMAVLYISLSPPALAQPVETDGLTLDQAVTLALQSNPLLAAGEHAVSAAEARVDQAGLFPNPEIDLESENFGGSGPFSNFGLAENTATITQPFVTGSKLKRRRAGAESERLLAGRDLESVRLDVIAGTTAAFYRVLVDQRRKALGNELLGLAESFAQTVQLRVEAGKVSPVEGTRAKIEVAQARARLVRAARELEAARARLAAMWGSGAPAFGPAVGTIPAPTLPPSLEQLKSYLLETPEIVRLDDLLEFQRRAVRIEQSLGKPDIRVSVGRRRFTDLGESAWVAGVSVPLPIFDRNQGSIRAAKFELQRTQRVVESVQITLDAQLADTFQRLHAAAQETIIVDREVVPSANAAFAAVETGYREGKFGFLDVLDAQRALFDARSLSLDNHEEYFLSRTELERLIGRSLGTGIDTAARGRYPAQGESR